MIVEKLLIFISWPKDSRKGSNLEEVSNHRLNHLVVLLQHWFDFARYFSIYKCEMLCIFFIGVPCNKNLGIFSPVRSNGVRAELIHLRLSFSYLLLFDTAWTVWFVLELCGLVRFLFQVFSSCSVRERRRW